MQKKELSKTFWYVLLAICLVLIILVAIGFGVFAGREETIVEEKENGGNITLNYSSNLLGLKLVDATRTTDSVGMKNLEEGEYFDFSVDVALDNAPFIVYEVAVLKDTKNSTIADDDIRIYLEKEKSGTYTSVFEANRYVPIEEESELGSPVGSMILTNVKKTKTSVDNYRLRMWLSDKALSDKGNYSVQVIVNGNAN